MKKFRFSLEKVLDYKTQVEDNLKNEHAQAVKRVTDQEKVIAGLEKEFGQCRVTFEEKKKEGCVLYDLQVYENYLSRINRQIRQEKEVLTRFKVEAEKKRQLVVAAKVETSSIEKLKEKKVQEYNKEMQKSDEQFIEEFVSNLRSERVRQA